VSCAIVNYVIVEFAVNGKNGLGSLSISFTVDIFWDEWNERER
jgi:hypothetical protein